MTSATDPLQDPPAKPKLKTLGLGGFALELLLPATLSAVLLFVVARYVSSWDLHTLWGIGLFGVLLVAFSFVLSIWIDDWTLARRRRAGKSQLLNRADARSRLVKFVLGGVVIPLALFGAANLMKVPGRGTPMSLVAGLAVKKPDVSREEQIGSVVLRAKESAVKTAGISALQASNSPAALNQLFRILTEDPAVAVAEPEAQILAQALASYGKLATPLLLERFSESSHTAPAISLPERDAFDLYLGAGFEALKIEAGTRGLDPAAKAEALTRLQGVEAQVRRILDEAQWDRLTTGNGNVRARLILQTFLEMNPAEAADLLPFACRVATDATCADGVRGRALLLVARLGGKDDLALLFDQLSSPSPLVQVRALQAIAELNRRMAPGAR